MKKLITRYRLVELIETTVNRDEFLELRKKADSHNYDYNTTFDSTEEALVHATQSKYWEYRDFTILPIYSFDMYGDE